VRGTILGIIFALFVICFIAIIIEETLLGGRRVRRMEKTLKEKRNADNANR